MITGTKLAVEGGIPVIPDGRRRRWPEVLPEDLEAVAKVFEGTEWYGANGTEITALEREWADYVMRRHCISTNSGTAALHCAAAAVGVTPGDEVIVPAFTFIASALSMMHQGARPVFCDIEPDTFNIDPTLIEGLITERTAAVVPVHLQGLPADMDPILKLASKHGLAVIEDAAQAHGAWYKGSKAGSIGDCAAFSLNATKTLSGGEGGLFVTDDDEAFKVARRLTNFGEDAPPTDPDVFRPYATWGLGWMYRNHEVPAAFARSQLRRLDGYVENARTNAAILTRGLAEIPGVLPPHVPEGSTHAYHKFRVRLDLDALGVAGRVAAVELRDRLLRALRAEGLVISLWQLMPLPAQPIFRRRDQGPWRPSFDAEGLAAWHPEEYPVAVETLEKTIVVGSEFHPLAILETAQMEQYLEAFHKVLGRLDAVLELPYRPVQTVDV